LATYRVRCVIFIVYSQPQQWRMEHLSTYTLSADALCLSKETTWTARWRHFTERCKCFFVQRTREIKKYALFRKQQY
jgi:hypothetical protein